MNDKKPKDRLKFELNPLSGELDLISQFNEDRIVSHTHNPAGHALYQYDPILGTWYASGPEVVFDEKGNVVVV